MIKKGSKFKAHDTDREDIYAGRVYEVKSIAKRCVCPDPNDWLNSIQGNRPRPEHVHIRAKLVQVPVEDEFRLKEYNDYYFNGYCERTLKHLKDSGYWLELVK